MLFPFSFLKTGGFDPDAQAFFDRVTAAGGSLTTTEKNATNQLVLDMKSAGIWTAMRAVYPMVGASAAACAQNLKSSSFTGTFTSGWTFASTGVTPNGTSAYFDTTLLPSTTLTNNNTHISFYSRTNTSLGGVVIGTSKNASALPLFTIYTKGAGNDYFNDAYSYVNNRITVTSALTSAAFFINTRTTSTSFKVFRNSSQFGTTNTVSSSENITTCDKAFFIGALNLNGTAGQLTPNQCAFASIGDGLTDTQASDFYTAVQTFNTTLSRQV